MKYLQKDERLHRALLLLKILFGLLLIKVIEKKTKRYKKKGHELKKNKQKNI